MNDTKQEANAEIISLLQRIVAAVERLQLLAETDNYNRQNAGRGGMAVAPFNIGDRCSQQR